TALSVAASLSAAIGGQIGIAISGAGAESTNEILTHADAYVQGSKLTAHGSGKVVLDAENTSSIKATVVAASAALAFGSTAGVGASVGVAVARNLIGENVDSGMAFDKMTTDTLPATLTMGTKVKIASGARAGDIYQYVGQETTTVYNFTS